MYPYIHDSIGSQRPVAHPGPPQPPPLHMPDRISHQHPQQTAPYMIPQAHHIPPAHHPPHLPLVGNMQQPPPLQQQQAPDMTAQTEDEKRQQDPPPTPKPFRTVCDGRIWELSVCQQPVRARMCGFGDKDRRPITPPPCIRLIVKDEHTGKEVNVNDIDTSYYILTVDIFDEKGEQEMNIVKTANSGSPSISNSSTISYPPSAINPNPPYPPPSATSSIYCSPASAQPASANSYQSSNSYGYASAPSSAYSSQYSPQQFPPRPNGYQPPTANYQQLASPTTPIGYPGHFATPRPYPLPAPPNEAPNSAFTRNLIGSLSASAFRLHDDQEKHGVWFVMQDLSVRTEGSFRLKFNFMNLSEQAGSSESQPQPLNGGGGPSAVTPTSPNSSARPHYSSNAPSTQQNTQLNTGFAPVLAYAFSEIFTVFSAKRFPGVIESTGLSRTFAAQGIKIPIRKDNEQKNGNGKRPRREGDEDDDDGGDDD